MSSEPTLFLHDHGASSYAQKVRLALREKGIPFDKKTPEGLGGGHRISGLAEANMRMEVPALEDGDFKIFDSKVILGYLEDKYPSHPLLPADPKGRAKAKMIEEVCDSQYEAINWGISEVLNASRATGEMAEKLLAAARSQTAEIHSWLASHLGNNAYFAGESFGYADLVVVPYMNRSYSYDYLPQEESLRAWRERVMQRPSCKQTYEEMQDGLKGMREAFKTAFLPGSGRRREYRDHRLEWMVKAGGLEVVEKGVREDTIRFSWPGGV